MEKASSNPVKVTVKVNEDNFGTMAGWGWQKRWSPRAQRYFWYNKSKRVSVWELEDILKLQKPQP